MWDNVAQRHLAVENCLFKSSQGYYWWVEDGIAIHPLWTNILPKHMQTAQSNKDYNNLSKEFQIYSARDSYGKKKIFKVILKLFLQLTVYFF